MNREQIINLICDLIPSQRKAGINRTPQDLMESLVEVLTKIQGSIPEEEFGTLIAIGVSLVRMEFAELDAGISTIEAINKLQQQAKRQ